MNFLFEWRRFITIMLSWLDAIVYLGLEAKWSHLFIYIQMAMLLEFPKGNYLIANTSHFESINNKQIFLSVCILMMNALTNIFETHMMRMRQMIVMALD